MMLAVVLVAGYFVISIVTSGIMARLLGVGQPDDEDRLMIGLMGMVWPLTLICVLAWSMGAIATKAAR